MLRKWIVGKCVQVKEDVTVQAGVKREGAPELVAAALSLHFLQPIVY